MTSRLSSSPLRASICLFALACAALAANAQSTPGAPRATASASAVVDDTLYRDLGGQPGLVALMHDFVPRVAADPRIGHFFAKTNLPNLEEMLVLQVCKVAGGGCNYNGMKMKQAHEEMDIRMADFNALVEVLQVSMDERGIPFATQNRLLARLAPMHRDIVNTP